MKTRFVASLFLLSLALLAIITISDLGAGSLVDHQDQPFIANAMGPKAAVSYLSSQLILTFIEVQRDGVDGVEGIGQASSAMVSPDGKHVYVAGSEDNTVAAFSRHSSTGKLTFIESQDEGIGEEARYAAVSPDGKHVYVASEMGSTIAVFGRDGMTGNLTYVTTYDSDDICCIHDVVSVSLSPEGAHLYTAASDDDAVSVFERNAITGELTLIEVQKDGVGGVDGLSGARWVAVSPDGAHIYVASRFADAVTLFTRETVTGKLTFIETHKDGVGGVEGLDYVSSVTVSPDGAHVYATGANDDAVAVFIRDEVTGKLTYVEMQKDGVGGVEDLDWAWSVAVSPNGKYVYVASPTDDAVVVFGRDTTTGKLIFIESYKDGVGGVDGLDGAHSVTTDAHGSNLYVAAEFDNAVAVFESRDFDFAIYLPSMLRTGP